MNNTVRNPSRIVFGQIDCFLQVLTDTAFTDYVAGINYLWSTRHDHRLYLLHVSKKIKNKRKLILKTKLF